MMLQGGLRVQEHIQNTCIPTHSTKNEWDKLEALVLSQGYDTIAISGMSPTTGVLGGTGRAGEVEVSCCPKRRDVAAQP